VPALLDRSLDAYGAWRHDTAERLDRLQHWLDAHRLSDTATQSPLRRVVQWLQDDRLLVAFVAEFSRGKSELINALLFAGSGQRIVPARAGRTTMCPTEFGYDAALPPCIRLLPIDSRLDPRPLSAWRAEPEAWTRLPLDPADPPRMAAVMERVAQVRRMPVAAARALGFWDDEAPASQPVPDARGQVEVPMWRHALVNIDHPLLRRGLVVLDTPGLNAVGVEPELTLDLRAHAHAVVFVLGADIGVSRSDLALWRDQLAPSAGRADTRLAVLNKSDLLRDPLGTPQQAQTAIARQLASVAALLGVPPARVLPVSARDGLVARIAGDEAALQASGLPALEAHLADELLGRRRALLREAVAALVDELRAGAARQANIQRRDLDEQALELRALRGKNSGVIAGMRERVQSEQRAFDTGQTRIHSIRTVHARMLRDCLAPLDPEVAQPVLAELSAVLQRGGLKLGIGRRYEQAVDRLAAQLQQAATGAAELHTMLDASFRGLNAGLGFSLQAGAAPSLARQSEELRRTAGELLPHLDLTQRLRLAQPAFAARMAKTLDDRVQALFADARADLAAWGRSAIEPLRGQLDARRAVFLRRIDALDRIREAASGLDERLQDIDGQIAALAAAERQLYGLLDALVGLPPAAPAQAAPATGTAP
jgi:hypothetical protein